MRRKDREVTDIVRIREILEKSKVVHIGLIDGKYPYVFPMNYGFELSDNSLVLYLHGAKEGRKIDLITGNSHAGFALECETEQVSGGDIPCKYGLYYASVIGEGRIVFIEKTEEKIHALKVLMKNQTGRDFEISETMADSVCVMKLICTSFSAKSRPKQ